MTKIKDLIEGIYKSIPFKTESDAKDYLLSLEKSDPEALISALYMGRDHLQFKEFVKGFITEKSPFNRKFCRQLINSNEYATVLYEKGNEARRYYDAFIRCAKNSGYDLDKF